MYKIKCIYNESRDSSEYMTSHTEYDDEKLELETSNFVNITNIITEKYEKQNSVYRINDQILIDMGDFFANLDPENLPEKPELFTARESLDWDSTDYSLELFITKID